MGEMFNGVPVILKEGMLRTGWFIRDVEGRVLSCGTLGMGVLETPEAGSLAAKIECGSEVYRLLSARPAKENEGHG